MSNEQIERRQFVRLPVSLMISLKSGADADDFIDNYTHDLSLGGMFLKTSAPKAIGTDVCLQMHTPPPTGLIEINGKVVYHNIATSDGVLSGMGIEFTEMSAKARVVLRRFINGARTELFHKSPGGENWAIVNAIGSIVHIIDLSLTLIHRPF